MNGVAYTLVLLEPVLANSLAGDANSAQSLPYIPGGLVRGALVGLYLRQQESGLVATTDPDFRRLFLTPATRFLHAYPMYEKRVLPTPLAWKVTKNAPDQKEVIYNLAEQLPKVDDLTAPPFNFWWQSGDRAYYSEAGQQVNVHTQRDAVLGRAATNRGAVFRYEALPAGLRVQGIVLTDTAEDASQFRSWLTDQEMQLGKARTAGYGRVRVETVEYLPANWREGWSWELVEDEFTRLDREADFAEEFDSDLYQEYEDPTAATEFTEFTLTFVSAGLVRETCGQFTLDPTVALQARLGGVELSARAVFRRGEIVGGFNRQWGLPLPQVIAIAAGSVFKYEATTPITKEKLDALEESGIGERREEGFGRVIIEIDSQAEIACAESQLPQLLPDLTGVQLDVFGEATARMMLGRLLRRQLDEKLLRKIQEYSLEGTVPNNQLSRWRTVVRNLWTDKDLSTSDKLQRMSQFYAAEEKKRSAAWQKMDRARLVMGTERIRLTQWIYQTLTGEQSPWDILTPGEQAPQMKLGPVTIEADETWAMEFRLRLIDGVLEKARRGNNE